MKPEEWNDPQNRLFGYPQNARLNPHQKILKIAKCSFDRCDDSFSGKYDCLFLLLIKSFRLECLAQVLKILWLPCGTPWRREDRPAIDFCQQKDVAAYCRSWIWEFGFESHDMSPSTTENVYKNMKQTSERLILSLAIPMLLTKSCTVWNVSKPSKVG